MSFVQVTALRCDVHGCPRTFTGHASPLSALALRSEAAVAGWREHDGVDVCWYHARASGQDARPMIASELRRFRGGDEEAGLDWQEAQA